MASLIMQIAAPLALGSEKLKITSSKVSGNHLVLEWTGSGSLQSSTNLKDAWVTVENARSPFLAPLTGPTKYYRVLSVARTITPVDDTTVRIIYDRPMDISAIDPSNYAISSDHGDGVEIISAKFGSSKSVVELSTTPQTYGDYQVAALNIQDTAGQEIFFEGRKITGNPKGAVVSVAATSSTRVVVAYNEPMADNALAPQHYSIVDANDKALLVIDAQFDGPLGMIVVLTTEPQADLNHQLTVSNVTDLQNDELHSNTGSFLGIGDVPTLVATTSTGPNTLLLTFSEAMSDDALDPSSYQIVSASGEPLRVQSGRFLGSERRVVVLTTDPQGDETYTIELITATDLDGNQAVVPTSPTTSAFQGIGASALIKAIPTLPTRLILTFSGPVGDSALAPSTYTIEGIDAAGAFTGNTLPISDARFVGDQRTVVQLTTGSQLAVPYQITTTDALTDIAGSSLPMASTEFQGIGSRPTLVSATSVGSSTLLMTFNEAMSDDALAPGSYQIESANGDPLRILSGVFMGTERRLIELTTDPQSSEAYMIDAITATDLDGNKAVVPDDSTINTFPGRGTPSEAPDISGPPRLVGASSISSTEVIAVFSEPLADNAEESANYVIIQENVNPEAGVLLVTGAEFYQGNRSVVRLTTLTQNELVYRGSVVNVTDRAGNVVDPLSARFRGTPGGAIDTDGDGLSDSEEMRGWIVTIALANNTVIERGVTSDPFVADTDDDGIPDSDELSARTDPRDADTDDDGLTDTEEIDDNLGDPTKQDTDGDGLTDKEEKTGWTVIITQIDGTTVKQQVTSNPFLADSDYDGLLDFLERIAQTDPNNPDSDGDGVPDGPEVLAGTDPTENNPDDALAEADPNAPPRVVGAASLSNTSVLVSFSKPMSDDVLKTAHYFIIQEGVNPEVGFVPVLSVEFNPGSTDRRSVLLTTGSQNELTYSVTVLNVTDENGNALTSAVIAGSQRVDPTTAVFPGSPPSGTEIVDSDSDGLSDNVEVRGWTITVTRTNGDTVTREVTSDTGTADTDGDKLSDAEELSIGTDPRSADTDGDQLNDYAEFNEIYSDPTNQDSDGDGLDDGLEFNFFHTAPFHADTDGDQLTDGEEVLLGNRNPRVADLPTPAIEMGDTNLTLDVRFAAVTETQSRDLESKSINTTLSQSQNKEFSNQDANTQEVFLRVEGGYEPGDGGRGDGGFINVEGGWTGSWTSSFTATSAEETQREFQESLSTEAEVTAGESIERTVEGARMQVTMFLKNDSNLAYRLKNLQVTAFIQDPRDPTRLRPIATLLPESEPGEGYTLGPLLPERRPVILSSDTVFPDLVDSLLKNPRGLIFKFSNFDIIDELDRNFAFSAREIIDRTGAVVLDFGGFDGDGDGEGDLTEYHRVATSAGRPIDTNGDGVIDASDHRVLFDEIGNEVGVTLREALAAIGLKHYDEATIPSTSLSADELENSYSTKLVAGEERIFRVRDTMEDELLKKYWAIVTDSGINPGLGLDNLLVKTDGSIRLALARDVDGDLLAARTEFLQRTSDTNRDTDRDGLDDRFETRIGWKTDIVGLGTLETFSSPTLVDSDRDGLSDFEEAPSELHVIKVDADGKLIFGANGKPETEVEARDGVVQIVDGTVFRVPLGYDLQWNGSLPATGEKLVIVTQVSGDIQIRIFDTDGTQLIDQSEDNLVSARDLEFLRKLLNDGVYPDASETDPKKKLKKKLEIIEKAASALGHNLYDPATNPPALIQRAAQTSIYDLLNPLNEYDFVTDPLNPDTDFDSIPDADEVNGFNMVFHYPLPNGTPVADVRTDPANPDTDGDTANDGVERRVGCDPRDPRDQEDCADDDGDGLANIQERKGWFVTHYEVSTNPGVRGTAVTTLERVTSDPQNPDTDGDGLSDFKEFDLRPDLTDISISSNPRNIDTDGDGLSDAVELLGFELKDDFRDYGIISLNPIYADVDHDMRSDSEETELKDVNSNGQWITLRRDLVGSNEGDRWIVRLEEQAPRRVVSDPRIADSDFDLLVDGQEFDAGTDPNNFDTDGDSRDDRFEFLNMPEFNPLKVEDATSSITTFQVTVVYSSLSLTRPRDGGTSGDVGFDFNVRLPDEEGIAGLSSSLTHVVGDTRRQTGNFTADSRGTIGEVENEFPYFCLGPYSSICRDDESWGIQLGAGDTLLFAGLLPEDKDRSITFTMTADQTFSVEGVVAERDPYGADGEQYAQIFFGGLDGVRYSATDDSDDFPASLSEKRAVFHGDELLAGDSVIDLVFNFDIDDNLFETIPIDNLNKPSGAIEGNVKAYIIVH